VTSPKNVYKIGDTIYGVFVVYDQANVPITGLTAIDFAAFLSNEGVNSSGTVTIVEVGSGRYGYSFVATDGGEWYLVIRSATYNARGWQDGLEIAVRFLVLGGSLKMARVVKSRVQMTVRVMESLRIKQ
jgi:hypothetical protein